MSRKLYLMASFSWTLGRASISTQNHASSSTAREIPIVACSVWSSYYELQSIRWVEYTIQPYRPLRRRTCLDAFGWSELKYGPISPYSHRCLWVGLLNKCKMRLDRLHDASMMHRATLGCSTLRGPILPSDVRIHLQSRLYIALNWFKLLHIHVRNVLERFHSENSLRKFRTETVLLASISNGLESLKAFTFFRGKHSKFSKIEN